MRGVKTPDGGRLHLKGVRTPSGWCSTPEWVQEFFDAMTQESKPRNAPLRPDWRSEIGVRANGWPKPGSDPSPNYHRDAGDMSSGRHALPEVRTAVVRDRPWTIFIGASPSRI